MIAYLQVSETAWAAFLAVSDEDLQAGDPKLARMRRTGRMVTGYWNVITGFTNVNALGSEVDLDALHDYFQPSDVNMYFKWGYNGKVNFPTEYTGQYNDILTLHEDHADGSPATFEDPNWANVWAGQTRNRFSREFSREFGEEFG